MKSIKRLIIKLTQFRLSLKFTVIALMCIGISSKSISQGVTQIVPQPNNQILTPVLWTRVVTDLERGDKFERQVSELNYKIGLLNDKIATQDSVVTVLKEENQNLKIKTSAVESVNLYQQKYITSLELSIKTYQSKDRNIEIIRTWGTVIAAILPTLVLIFKQ